MATALDAVEKDFPTITIQDQTELKESISDQIGQLLNLVYALLALSVIIAIVGVINTLALSVLERTREIGLLRAVGTLRKQIRSMIRWESMVISFFGAVIGVFLGVFLGVALQRLLVDDGITLAGHPLAAHHHRDGGHRDRRRAGGRVAGPQSRAAGRPRRHSHRVAQARSGRPASVRSRRAVLVSDERLVRWR